MLIDIGQSEMPRKNAKASPSPPLPPEFYSCSLTKIHLRVCSPIRRKLRAICAKIKSKCKRARRFEKVVCSTRRERERDTPLPSFVLARADTRFEWLIFFLLFASLPPSPLSAHPCRVPSTTMISRLPLIVYLFSVAEDETTKRFDGGHLAANYD